MKFRGNKKKSHVLIYCILFISILVLVIGYYESIESRFHYFYNCLDNLSTRFVCINRIYNILNYKNKNMLVFGNNQTDEISGKIEFKNVFFTYEDQLILKMQESGLSMRQCFGF